MLAATQYFDLQPKDFPIPEALKNVRQRRQISTRVVLAPTFDVMTERVATLEDASTPSDRYRPHHLVSTESLRFTGIEIYFQSILQG
jgi:hypothetical protein